MRCMKVEVTVYRYTGKHLGFLTIQSSACKDCELTYQVVKEIEKELKGGDVKFKYRQWFNWFWSALIQGVYHPPGVVVNGKVFVQGVAPNKQKLKKFILNELKK